MPQLTLTFVGFVAVAALLFWFAPRRHRPLVLTIESVLFLGWLALEVFRSGQVCRVAGPSETALLVPRTPVASAGMRTVSVSAQSSSE